MLQLTLKLTIKPHNCIYHHAKVPQDSDVKKTKKKGKKPTARKKTLSKTRRNMWTSMQGRNELGQLTILSHKQRSY